MKKIKILSLILAFSSLVGFKSLAMNTGGGGNNSSQPQTIPQDPPAGPPQGGLGPAQSGPLVGQGQPGMQPVVTVPNNNITNNNITNQNQNRNNNNNNNNGNNTDVIQKDNNLDYGFAVPQPGNYDNVSEGEMINWYIQNINSRYSKFCFYNLVSDFMAGNYSKRFYEQNMQGLMKVLVAHYNAMTKRLVVDQIQQLCGDRNIDVWPNMESQGFKGITFEFPEGNNFNPNYKVQALSWYRNLSNEDKANFLKFAYQMEKMRCNDNCLGSQHTKFVSLVRGAYYWIKNLFWEAESGAGGKITDFPPKFPPLKNQLPQNQPLNNPQNQNIQNNPQNIQNNQNFAAQQALLRQAMNNPDQTIRAIQTFLQPKISTTATTTTTTGNVPPNTTMQSQRGNMPPQNDNTTTTNTNTQPVGGNMPPNSATTTATTQPIIQQPQDSRRNVPPNNTTTTTTTVTTQSQRGDMPPQSANIPTDMRNVRQPATTTTTTTAATTGNVSPQITATTQRRGNNNNMPPGGGVSNPEEVNPINPNDIRTKNVNPIVNPNVDLNKIPTIDPFTTKKQSPSEINPNVDLNKIPTIDPFTTKKQSPSGINTNVDLNKIPTEDMTQKNKNLPQPDFFTTKIPTKENVIQKSKDFPKIDFNQITRGTQKVDISGYGKQESGFGVRSQSVNKKAKVAGGFQIFDSKGDVFTTKNKNTNDRYDFSKRKEDMLLMSSMVDKTQTPNIPNIDVNKNGDSVTIPVSKLKEIFSVLNQAGKIVSIFMNNDLRVQLPSIEPLQGNPDRVVKRTVKLAPLLMRANVSPDDLKEVKKIGSYKQYLKGLIASSPHGQLSPNTNDNKKVLSNINMNNPNNITSGSNNMFSSGGNNDVNKSPTFGIISGNNNISSNSNANSMLNYNFGNNNISSNNNANISSNNNFSRNNLSNQNMNNNINPNNNATNALNYTLSNANSNISSNNFSNNNNYGNDLAFFMKSNNSNNNNNFTNNMNPNNNATNALNYNYSYNNNLYNQNSNNNMNPNNNPINTPNYTLSNANSNISSNNFSNNNMYNQNNQNFTNGNYDNNSMGDQFFMKSNNNNNFTNNNFNPSSGFTPNYFKGQYGSSLGNNQGLNNQGLNNQGFVTSNILD